uniref:Uncharacterized protein n=1 Tax=Myotis myotis TaxID=51298 RepID=A0A7J7Y0P3_MYOMY|nr:hypothetical protein mMyoMyo1_011349 [Myotis myotis]
MSRVPREPSTPKSGLYLSKHDLSSQNFPKNVSPFSLIGCKVMFMRQIGSYLPSINVTQKSGFLSGAEALPLEVLQVPVQTLVTRRARIWSSLLGRWVGERRRVSVGPAMGNTLVSAWALCLAWGLLQGESLQGGLSADSAAACGRTVGQEAGEKPRGVPQSETG